MAEDGAVDKINSRYLKLHVKSIFNTRTHSTLLTLSVLSAKMRSVGCVIAVVLLSTLITAHEHVEDTGYQEPFVGWTQEDLDAKWGTDVCSMLNYNLNPV